MSVLNDALKRASEAQQEHDTVRINFDRLPPMPAPAPASKPQPTRDSAPESKQEPTWGWPAELETKKGHRLAVPALVILLIAAGAYIGMRHISKKPTAQGAAIVPVSQPVHATAPAPRPIPTRPPARVQTAAVAAPAAVPEPVSWPSLNVQAIFYSGAKSQAIVNSKTVYVGGTVDDGIRVAGISRNSVLFVAPDGSHKKLNLGE